MTARGSDLSAGLDGLYSAPQEEFVSRRNELARRYRSEGRDQDAAFVKELSKPTLAAWALNQAVRRRRKEVEWLLEAEDKVRSAKGPEAVVKASAARREIIQRLVAAAMSAVQEAGRPVTAVLKEKVALTVQAVASNDEARERLKEGRFAKEMTPTPFESDSIR